MKNDLQMILLSGRGQRPVNLGGIRLGAMGGLVGISSVLSWLQLYVGSRWIFTQVVQISNFHIMIMNWRRLR
jgi:hypothetical protein